MTNSIRSAIAWPTVAAAGWLAVASAVAQTTLELATAALESAPRERVFDGRVEAVNQATVSAQTAGRVAEVYYDVDDYVEAGSPIVRFTDVEQQSALRQAQAALEEAIARDRQAADDFERMRALREDGTISQRDFDQARASRDAAQARVTAARSAVRTAEQQAEYTLVRAPYAGIVTARHVEPGETVNIGQPLMSGLSLEALRVTADLPQEVTPLVRERRTAAILTAEGRVTPTELTIFPTADSATNTFRVRLELPQGQFGLYPGMFVKVAFVVGDADRLLVPAEAIMRRSEVTGVYVVGDDGTVRLRQVRVGAAADGRIEILAGLAPGERVAVDPVQAAIEFKAQVARRDE
jgi:RND family efflux transporter MFP subunit